MSILLTGDHAEIDALTRAKCEDKLFSNFPPKAKEMLIPNPTFLKNNFKMLKNGFRLRKTLRYLTISFALEMLLRENAKQFFQRI